MVVRNPYHNLKGHKSGYYFHCKDGHDSKIFATSTIAYREGMKYAKSIDSFTHNQLWENYANSPLEFFEVKYIEL